jgi:hypothetical protein
MNFRLPFHPAWLLTGLPLLWLVRPSKTAAPAKPVYDLQHPPPDAVFLNPPAGYRRATSSEVTGTMSSAAFATLSKPLGTTVLRDNYALGVESHYHPEGGTATPWGWHKGVSVFVRA